MERRANEGGGREGGTNIHAGGTRHHIINVWTLPYLAQFIAYLGEPRALCSGPGSSLPTFNGLLVIKAKTTSWEVVAG